jgi:hypothetical protein
MRIRSTIAAVAAATLAAAALPALASAEEPLQLQAAAEPEESQDADIDRGFLLSTAETQPKGSITTTNYEFFVLGTTYAVTDGLQVGAVAAIPLPGEDGGADGNPFGKFALLSAKLRVLKTERFRTAVQGSIINYSDEYFDDALMYSLGLIGSYCLDERCESLLTGNASAFLGGTDPSNGLEEQNLLVGGSIIVAVTDGFKLLAEVVTNANHDAGGWDLSDAALVTYGFRTTSRHVSADIGLMKPITTEDGVVEGAGDDQWILGVPFVSFTYRIM